MLWRCGRVPPGGGDSGEDYSRRKFEAIKKETNADLIVVSCITCLMYMDAVQAELSNGEGEYSIPVFDYNQLLSLCQGFDPQNVARISKVPTDRVLKQMASSAASTQPLPPEE